ncbi:unnamed protein product [Blepharisma stoltei]|uniref:Alpha N-terminal protein methyltransferase 1 n=1 Tax=Blepharisma stoltei TaxID=1481888 RepID=A0AAU9J9S0_9CILI|nr:unnamed protein product [Blepharisma stoltei]
MQKSLCTVTHRLKSTLKKCFTSLDLTKDEIKGKSSQGEKYKSINELWQNQVGISRTNWYEKGKNYWEAQESTLDGVLGGFSEIHQADISASNKFIKSLKSKNYIIGSRALDCGSGIGRITKNLLLNHFAHVDLVDQSEKFIEDAKHYINDNKVENYFVKGLQDFSPQKELYDCIWIQWILAYIIDEDLVAALKRIKAGLVPNGVLCIKENVLDEGFIYHNEDFSVTRSDKLFKIIIKKAGLKIIHEETQKDFPSEYFKVKMYGCIPKV